MKKIGGAKYVHMSNVLSLREDLERVARAASLLPEEFKPQVIKVTPEYVTFIISADFDTANEPEVGDAYKISNDGNIKFIKARGQIYHHKWMFVHPDYTGFDREESICRSYLWENLLDLNKSARSRIGNKKFWLELLKNNGIEP